MDLKVGQQLLLKGGEVAEVIENINDGIWIQVRYIKSPGDASLVGLEELCHCEEVVALVELDHQQTQ
ncbi:MAG: hypothetical protein EPN72_14865 [Nevskiaceae bacterium]|nr:MAG: hypothetical protein EPN72_14865 [Nevskiaceae bacterium]